MNIFLSGAIFMGAFVSFLFFLRFWRDSGDRLFLFFAFSFLLLGLERLAIFKYGSDGASQWPVYSIRLIAFVVLIIGIIHKNRNTKSGI